MPKTKQPAGVFLSRFRLSFVLRAIALFALVAVGLEARAKVIFVNGNAPLSSRHDGTSWANAYTDLSVAISNANPTASSPVEIWIANGTYKPTSGTNRYATFSLKS